MNIAQRAERTDRLLAKITNVWCRIVFGPLARFKVIRSWVTHKLCVWRKRQSRRSESEVPANESPALKREHQKVQLHERASWCAYESGLSLRNDFGCKIVECALMREIKFFWRSKLKAIFSLPKLVPQIAGQVWWLGRLQPEVLGEVLRGTHRNASYWSLLKSDGQRARLKSANRRHLEIFKSRLYLVTTIYCFLKVLLDANQSGNGLWCPSSTSAPRATSSTRCFYC